LGIIGLFWLYVLYKRKESANEKASVEMIKCHTCGVNFPKSEAIGSGDHWFCSEEHKS